MPKITPEQQQAKADDVAKRAARKAAIDALIETYPAEFEALMLAEHKARGVEWKRRLTPEERAQRDEAQARERAAAKARREAQREEKALEKFLSEHPSLAERLVKGEEGQAV